MGWGVVTGLAVAVSEVGGVTVLGVVGEIDLESAPNLRAVIARTLRAGPRALVLDLSGVEFMASVGLQILDETRAAVGGAFAVAADGPATSRPIRLTRLDEIVDLYPTVGEAVAALGG